MGWQQTEAGQTSAEASMRRRNITGSLPGINAETCHQFLHKGRKVYAEGRLQSHSYTGQDGIKKTGVEIVLERIEMLDSMPQDVKQRMELADALADGSNGHHAQQV